MPESLLMVRFGFRKRINMLFRDHENMRRSLRRQVVKGDANIVLINLGRRNTSIDYLAEDAIRNGHIATSKLNHSARGSAKSRRLGFDRGIGEPFDVRPDRTQLANDRLVTAVDVIDAID